MSNQSYDGPIGVEVIGDFVQEYAGILTRDALEFVASLERRYRTTRDEFLDRRTRRQVALDAGNLPHFLPETAHIRTSDWSIGNIPADLQDRRVEITGPSSDRKMVINALNSGARVFMADFEDANSPTWQNTIQGQINLHDAVNRTISYVSPESKQYQLHDNTATLLVRPRGWHWDEKHILVDGTAVTGAFADFGLYVFHNAKRLLANGSGPYFYLPKMESHLEARLWNDVFTYSEETLGIPHGSIKATVLIETILATFELDEILYELRDHIVGCNCGRWDYIFSYIKKLRKQPDVVLPDRSEVTMTVPFMRKYSLFTIQTCHRRKAFAIGGMAAQIPIKNDPVANEAAIAKVREDKRREATDGHDGTWVAHPGLVPVAMEMFNQYMATPNQLHVTNNLQVTAQELLEVPNGNITEQGLRTNISVGIQYIGAWLAGRGAVPIFNLMEDAATAEISRAQVWQWIHHDKGVLSDGRRITGEMVQGMISEELEKVRVLLGDTEFSSGRYDEAAQLFETLSLSDDLEDFLTTPGYGKLEA